MWERYRMKGFPHISSHSCGWVAQIGTESNDRLSDGRRAKDCEA